MCQPATKRIVLAFLIYFMSKLNSWMKEIVSKRDLSSSYGTKSAAAGCKQAVNDDERCQSFAVVFFQQLHKLFGNINAITYFKPPYFTNRQILTPICGYGKEPFSKFKATTDINYFHWSLYQWCQLSRFRRETYAFLPRLPLSRCGT